MQKKGTYYQQAQNNHRSLKNLLAEYPQGSRPRLSRSSETGLQFYANESVENSVQTSIQEIYNDEQLREQLQLRGMMVFQSHTNIGQAIESPIRIEIEDLSVSELAPPPKKRQPLGAIILSNSIRCRIFRIAHTRPAVSSSVMPNFASAVLRVRERNITGWMRA